MTIEFTDRYQAIGMKYPDPKTMCSGDCEGIGRYPVKMSDDDLTPHEDQEIARVLQENKQDLSDGYAFIKCRECNGTGLRQTEETPDD